MAGDVGQWLQETMSPFIRLTMPKKKKIASTIQVIKHQVETLFY